MCIDKEGKMYVECDERCDSCKENDPGGACRPPIPESMKLTMPFTTANCACGNPECEGRPVIAVHADEHAERRREKAALSVLDNCKSVVSIRYMFASEVWTITDIMGRVFEGKTLTDAALKLMEKKGQ